MDVQPVVDVDPFDLPDWLGTAQVVWHADGGLRDGHLVAGRLTSEGEQDVVCDLLAVDDAYPVPVAADTTRLRAHQAWRHQQVLLGERGGRLTLVVPGTRFDPGLVLTTLGRLSKAVGASPDHWAALLRIGQEKPRRSQ